MLIIVAYLRHVCLLARKNARIYKVLGVTVSVRSHPPPDWILPQNTMILYADSVHSSFSRIISKRSRTRRCRLLSTTALGSWTTPFYYCCNCFAYQCCTPVGVCDAITVVRDDLRFLYYECRCRAEISDVPTKKIRKRNPIVSLATRTYTYRWKHYSTFLGTAVAIIVEQRRKLRAFRRLLSPYSNKRRFKEFILRQTTPYTRTYIFFRQNSLVSFQNILANSFWWSIFY